MLFVKAMHKVRFVPHKQTTCMNYITITLLRIFIHQKNW